MYILTSSESASLFVVSFLSNLGVCKRAEGGERRRERSGGRKREEEGEGEDRLIKFVVPKKNCM